MKLISLFLALFILGLTASPCSDVENEQDRVNSEVSVSDIDQSFPTDFDICSPLCSCHCCHTHITEGDTQEKIEHKYPSNVDKGYKLQIFDNHYFSIFQPPRA